MTLNLSNPDRKPLRDLPDDVRGAMFNSWLKGAQIEVKRGGDDWSGLSLVNWNPNVIYRIRPEPKTADVIPWAALKPEVKWVARCRDGYWFAFDMEEGKPIADSGSWTAREGSGGWSLGAVAGFVQGTCDWRDSLQQRPEGV